MRGVFKISVGFFVIFVVAVGAWLVAPLFYDSPVNEALPSELIGLDELVPAAETDQPKQLRENLDDSPTLPTNLAPTDIPVGAGSVAPTPVSGPRVIGQGTFVGADSFHQGSGTARFLETEGKQFVRFDEDFNVTNGPDLFVYLGRDGRYDPDTKLGKLKGNQGSQNYEVPSSIDAGSYNEVWVWCRAFSVPFSSARLE